LIYAPEMLQAELNVLCHVLFCAITNDTGYKSSAQTLYLGFKTRSQQVEEKFGEGTSDPAIFGHLLIDSGMTSSEQLDKVLGGIRLLPSRARFRKQIEAWAANALEEIAVKPTTTS
jgi:intracellular multiplication protein IcmJ